MAHRINTDMFDYHGRTRTFTQEASSLGVTFQAMFGHVFTDACDAGFELVSERTGKVIKMTLVEPVRDRENEIGFWEFIPYRNGSFIKLVVFND